MTDVQVRYTGNHTSREGLQADLLPAGAVVSPVEVNRSFETVKAIVARHRTKHPTNRIDLAKTD